MEYLKTYETFQLDFNEYSLNEGLWQNYNDFMAKPFAKIVKSKLDKKTDDEKLDLLEKLLKGINFTNSLKGTALTYSPLAILPIVGILIPSIKSEEHIVYWIYWIVWMLMTTLKFRYKKEVRNLIGMVKNDYIRNKMISVIEDKSSIDPFGEENWTGNRTSDKFEDRAEALLVDSYVYDIEITLERIQYPNRPILRDDDILNIATRVLIGELLDIHHIYNIDKEIIETRHNEIIKDVIIFKNVRIKMDKLKQFKKSYISKLKQVGRIIGISDINMNIIKK